MQLLDPNIVLSEPVIPSTKLPLPDTEPIDIGPLLADRD